MRSINFANLPTQWMNNHKKNCDLHVLTIEIKSSVILSLYYSVVLRKFSHSKTMASFIQLIHGSFFWIRASIESLHLMRFLIAYTFANFWQYFFFILSELCQSGKKNYIGLNLRSNIWSFVDRLIILFAEKLEHHIWAPNKSTENRWGSIEIQTLMQIFHTFHMPK